MNKDVKLTSNIYINLLRQARVDLESNTPISWEDFHRKVPNLTGPVQDKAFGDIYAGSAGSGSEKKHFMTINALMSLLQFEEFSHSLKAARVAVRLSWCAIGLTFFAIVAQFGTWVYDKVAC